jgi:hypothetical protein
MRKQDTIIVGIRGEREPTHCFGTGKPLKENPVSYSIGNNEYVCVNNGVNFNLGDLQIFVNHEIINEETDDNEY